MEARAKGARVVCRGGTSVLMWQPTRSNTMEAGPWIIAVACIAYMALRSYNEYQMWSDLKCILNEEAL